MSIILDSLKRAERERRVGDPPAADTRYEGKPSPIRTHNLQKRWWAALIIVNLTVIALLAVVFFQKQPAPEAVALHAQPAPHKATESGEVIQTNPPADKVISATASMEDQSSDQPGPEMEKTPTVPSPPAIRKENAPQGEVRFGPPVAVTEDEANTMAVIDPPPVPIDHARETAFQAVPAYAGLPSEQPPLHRTTRPAAPAPALETEILSPPTNAQTPPADADEEPQWVSVPQHPPAERPPTRPVQQESVVVAPPQPTAIGKTSGPAPAPPAKKRPAASAPNDQAPLLQDLPPDIREKLRHVKISVLVYAEPQEACLVYINARRYRTGDKIGTEGYLLERIVPDGIILDYGEGRVKIRSGY